MLSEHVSVAGFEPTGQSRTRPRSMSYTVAPAVAFQPNDAVAPDFEADTAPTSAGGEPAVPKHDPLLHASPVVHALPSVHAEPFALFGFEQIPVAESQVPAT